jgi:hypothetical protein
MQRFSLGETIPLKFLQQRLKSMLILTFVLRMTMHWRNYMLVFKDVGDIEFIPGTDPPEPFTLQRYEEVSGFGYSRIYLYLLHIFDEAEPDRLSISDSEDELKG